MLRASNLRLITVSQAKIAIIHVPATSLLKSASSPP
jgi:hypothetical protein